MCSISMCVIQVNKVGLKPTTYYTLMACLGVKKRRGSRVKGGRVI